NVITVSGSRLSGANVVVCDGVITAVGADAAVPSGAQVVDASGMTIYPGVVDGFSQYGLPAPAANAGRGGAGGGRGAGGRRPSQPRMPRLRARWTASPPTTRAATLTPKPPALKATA